MMERELSAATEAIRMTQAGSRRAFLAGATAVGIPALVASQVPEVAAASTVPVKLTCCLRRRPDLTEAAFYDYWLNQHGPFATKMLKQLGGYRYVQSHTNNRDLGLMVASSRGQVGQAYDGVTEVWFRSRQSLIDALATTQGAEANLRLAEDGTNFIDLPNSSYFMTREYLFLGGS